MRRHRPSGRFVSLARLRNPVFYGSGTETPYMKTIFLLLMTSGVAFSAPGGKTTCTDAGVNFTITDQTPGTPGLSSDGGGPYVNAENGVIGRINCDGDSLELSGSRHSLLLLGAALNGSAPSWANSPAPVAFFNILLGSYFNNAEPDPSFYSMTTYLEVTMATPNLGYFFDLESPNASAGGSLSPAKGVNTPLTTTPVNVTHYPQVVDGSGNVTQPETWVVTPVSSPAVGTLMSNAKGGLHALGQFNTAFSIVVTRQ